MAKTSDDTGLHTPPVTATDAATWDLFGHPNANSGAENQLKDGRLSHINPTNKCTNNRLKNCLFIRYHLPRSWLKPSQNLLLLFEELGGNPARIALVKRSLTGVCADVTEYHPNIKNWQIESYGQVQQIHKPKIHLHCEPGHSILPSSLQVSELLPEPVEALEILPEPCSSVIRCLREGTSIPP